MMSHENRAMAFTALLAIAAIVLAYRKDNPPVAPVDPQ